MLESKGRLVFCPYLFVYTNFAPWLQYGTNTSTPFFVSAVQPFNLRDWEREM